MRGFLAASLLLLCLPASLLAGERDVLFFDTGVVERDLRAAGGVAEAILPAAVDLASLRIAPGPGVTIIDVQRRPVQPSQQQRKALAQAEERLKQLEDRIAALAVKEDVYTSAARSQSSKAPKKSKTNPDPMASIRQGTDYAIAQLETVIRLKRRAAEELEGAKKDLESKRREANVGGTLLRIRTDMRDGRLVMRYRQKDLAWKPAASLRVKGGAGELLLSGGIPSLPAGAIISVSPSLVDSPAGAPVGISGTPRLSLPVSALVEEPLPGTPPAFRYRFLPPVTAVEYLPAISSCYREGEYLGEGSLRMEPAGTAMETLCGR